jgi:hypothetical protein
LNALYMENGRLLVLQQTTLEQLQMSNILIGWGVITAFVCHTKSVMTPHLIG